MDTGSTDYRDLVESLDAIFWEADPGTLRFTAVSPKAETLLGYPRAEWTSTPTFWADNLHPDDRQRALDTRAQAITRCEDHRIDYRFVTMDGRTRWIRDTVRLTCEGRRVKRIYGVMIDVTAAPSSFEDAAGRARQEGHLREGQKMEAIGRLAGGIAHDFNNLLTVIMGYSELVIQQLTADTPIRHDVEEIRQAGTSAAALTRQLLAFSRRHILQPQVLDLNGIVSRMSALLRRLIGDDLELATQLTTPLDRVWADPGQIEQIILNLALNARDAMPDGGSLTIETSNADLDARWVAQHPGAVEGRHVLLAISHTGAAVGGIVPAVDGIVRDSGGSLVVHSEPARGTTFRIFLPRTQRSADPPNVSQPAPQSRGGTETILLVEDQPEVRAVTRNMLGRRGYKVLEAANGAEALSILQNHDGEVHLLLTDIVMPRMSGLDLAEQLVSRRPGLRVLYTSGYTDGTVEQPGMLEPGMAFIHKPFTPNGLLQKVRDLLDAR